MDVMPYRMWMEKYSDAIETVKLANGRYRATLAHATGEVTVYALTANEAHALLYNHAVREMDVIRS